MESVLSAVALAGQTMTGVSESLDDFDALMAAHQRRIFRVLLAMTHDEDSAQTLTQECFLKAYQARRSFRGEAPVGAWLLRIAVNLGRDHIRSRRAAFWRRLFAAGKEPADIEQTTRAEQASPERELLAREQAGAVWRAVESLSAQQRTVFVLRFAEEMSLEEIATATGLRLGTVKTHLFRAVGAVRQRVKPRTGKESGREAGREE